jgi:hypothetical protein
LEPLRAQKADTIASNSSSGRRAQKTARPGRSDVERLYRYSVAPEESYIDDDFVGRSGLMLTASSGTVTLSPSGLFPLLLSPPDRSPREEALMTPAPPPLSKTSSFVILFREKPTCLDFVTLQSACCPSAINEAPSPETKGEKKS